MVNCTAADVNGLLDYLSEKGRDCHINSGIHGKEVNGNFEWDNELNGGDFLRQDVENATYQIEYKDGKEEKRARNIKISLHPIASANPPLYYSGVDTIDAFCLSYLRKLTEDELDKAYDDFLVKKNETSDRVDASVDHNDIFIDTSP